MKPVCGTLESVWTWYVAVVTAIVVGWGFSVEAAGHAPGRFLALQWGILAASWSIRWLRDANSRRVGRCAVALVGVPLAFSSLGWVLPGVHPEPWEWTWIAWDRAVFGCDPTVELQSVMTPAVTEVLQCSYACFYAIPTVVVIAVWRRRGGAALDHALAIVVFGFFASYLGYLLFPTLPPYRFLDHGEPLVGLWLTAPLRASIDALEFHRWDCFPSGHTMLSVLSLWLAWRTVRSLFWALLPLVITLVFSTMALRYHFVADVAAGLIAVPLCVWLGDRWFGLVPEPRPS